MLYEHIDIDKCGLSGKLLDSDFANGVPPEWESLVAKIKDIAPTNQEKDEIIRSVKQITSIHLNTVTCALCGIWDVDSKSDENTYSTINLLGEEMACMRWYALARLDRPDMESELQEYLRQNDSKRFVMSASV